MKQSTIIRKWKKKVRKKHKKEKETSKIKEKRRELSSKDEIQAVGKINEETRI